MLTLALPPTLIDSYIPKDNRLQSETVHYKRGVCQQFCLPSHTVDPSEWAEEEVSCLWGAGGDRSLGGSQGKFCTQPWTGRELVRATQAPQGHTHLQPCNFFIPLKGCTKPQSFSVPK